MCEFGLGLSGNIPLKELEGRDSKYESTKLLKSIAQAHAVFLTVVSAPSVYDLIPCTVAYPCAQSPDSHLCMLFVCAEVK